MSGVRRKEERWDAEGAGQQLLPERDDTLKLAADPMYRCVQSSL